MCEILNNLKTPTQVWNMITAWYQRHSTSFWAAIFFGFLAHAYMLFQKLPNHDDITSIRGYGSGYSSGRWFLGVLGDGVKQLVGTVSLPWINGLVTILLLAVAACVFVSLFDINNKIESVLVCGILVVFPAVTCLMNFMFTSYFYAIAILLVIFSCYMTVQFRFGFILGIVGLACATGIYQAYYMLAASILFLYLIFVCMDKEKKPQELFLQAAKFLLVLIAGIVVYLGVNNLFLQEMNIELTDYQALNEMGKINLTDIWHGIIKSYSSFADMFYTDYLGISSTWFIRLILQCSFFLDIILGGIWLCQRENIIKKISFCILGLLFPLAVNGLYILCPRSPYIYALMFYSLVIFWILPIILWNGIDWKFLKLSCIPIILNWCVVLCLGASTLYYARYANQEYLQMNFMLTQAESYYTTLITRIKSVPEYNDELKVAYIGEIQDATLYTANELFPDVTLAAGSKDIIGNYSWKKFIKIYLGFRMREVKDSKKEALSATKIVNEMPCYPDDGSIKIVQNVVVVKFSE